MIGRKCHTDRMTVPEPPPRIEPNHALLWVRELQGSGAATLADIAGYRDDFRRAQDACERILKTAAAPPVDATLVEHLWTSAVVSYLRPFQRDRRQQLPPSFLDALTPAAMQTHEQVKAIRNKHIAHSENTMETNLAIYELSDPAGGNREVLRVGTMALRRHWTPNEALALLHLIVERLSALHSLTGAIEAHVMTQMRDMDLDELYAEPSVLGLRVERGQSAANKRPQIHDRDPSSPVTLD